MISTWRNRLMLVMFLALVIVVGSPVFLPSITFAQTVGGPSAFCHETDGEFTVCPDGNDEWSDITPIFFLETDSYLYADQADLDPTLAGPESEMDTFMLMYDECELTTPLGSDEYFLVYFNTIEEEDGVSVFGNYVIHVFTDGTIIFIENGEVQTDENGEYRVEEIAAQRGRVGFGSSPNCAFDHVIVEFQVGLSITVAGIPIARLQSVDQQSAV